MSVVSPQQLASDLSAEAIGRKSLASASSSLPAEGVLQGITVDEPAEVPSKQAFLEVPACLPFPREDPPPRLFEDSRVPADALTLPQVCPPPSESDAQSVTAPLHTVISTQGGGDDDAPPSAREILTRMDFELLEPPNILDDSSLAEDAPEVSFVDDWLVDPEDFPHSARKRPWPLSDDNGEDTADEKFKKSRTYVHCFLPSSCGTVVAPTFLVNTARKRTVIVDVEDDLRMPQMRNVMDQEINSFKRMACIETVLMADLPRLANLVTTRRVFAIKTKEDGSKRYKARLVARGFEDDEKGTVTRDSPTASTSLQRLVLKALVERQWIPTSWDFETAFLQGKPIARDVYIAAPEGHSPPGTCWRLRKPVYGLVSAPKTWFDRLREVVQEHGFDADLSDEAIFRLRNNKGILVGILAIHVDDTIGGGTSEFHDVMDTVSEDLKIGSKESGTFHYKGLRISTVYRSNNADGPFEVVVDADEYLDCILPMNLPELADEASPLAPGDATSYRSVAGCIGYMASVFRPDLSLEASLLGRTFLTPTLRDAKKANAVLLWAKSNRYSMRFRRGTACLTAFSDSAGPNELGTQGGRLFALTDAESHKVSAWIYWESRKVKRVCRSTATGEILSLGECYNTAMWLRKIWHELTEQTLSVRLVVDSMGIAKSITTTKLPEKKRLRIDLAIVRQGLRRGDFVLTWVPSRANLSDPLTKEDLRETPRLRPSDSLKRPLIDALRGNCTNLRGVRSVTKTQADVPKY
jgi:hypothetical protein